LQTGERDKITPFSKYLNTIEPFDMPVERFLASLRFENRGKLDDLELEIDIKALKANN